MDLAPRRFADTLILSPRGRIDHATWESFKAALWPELATCAAGQDRVVLDLSGLDYISSAGLRVLLLASREVKPRGGEVAVASLTAVVREIFDISRFSAIFPMFPTVREAVAAGSPGALAAFDAA